MPYRVKKMWIYEIARKYHLQISTVLRLFQFAEPDTPDGKYEINISRARKLSARPKFPIAKFKPVMDVHRTVSASSRAFSDLVNGNLTPDSIENMMRRNDIPRNIVYFGKDNNFVYPIRDTYHLASALVLWDEFHLPLDSVKSGTAEENYLSEHNDYMKTLADRLRRFVLEVQREYDADASERRPRQLELPLDAPEGGYAGSTADDTAPSDAPPLAPTETPCKCTCTQDPILKITIEITPGKTAQELCEAFKDFIVRVGKS